jgi:uncharacterized protein YjbI with pentapeptide repeats
MTDLEQILSNHHRWFHSKGNEGQKAELNETNLQRANLQDANLNGAQLQNANLEEADLMWADLKGANIAGANLNGTYLRGADLSKTVGMSSSQINQAVVDENTLLPPSVFQRRN